MNKRELFVILKHNLEVLKDRPKCPVIDTDDNLGRIWRQGYEKAIEDMMGQVEQGIEDGEITWLSDAYDDRTAEAARSLDRDKWGRIKGVDLGYLSGAFERSKEEIYEQLKESIENILEDEVCETDDEMEERADEVLETFDGPIKSWPEITVKPITDETIDEIVERIREGFDEQAK